MPHILTSNHNDIITPTTKDNINFLFVANGKKENKICVKTQDKEFLLTSKIKANKTLIKIDSSTRISPVGIVKKSIDTYARIVKADLLFSNIQSNKAKVEPEKEYLKDIEYFVNHFKTNKEMYIEVGFGSGKHLIYQAIQNPDKLIIGIEIHTASIEKMLKQVKLQQIKNIIALNYDARLFLEFIKSNSVQKIFVHFPVPWDKKPHRRVISQDFIKESLRALKKDGTLEIRTDSEHYFNYCKELLRDDMSAHITTNKDLEITSKYEARWKRMNKDIWDIIITSNKHNDFLVRNYDFTFQNIGSINKELPNTPILKDDYFIHFGNQFKSENGQLLVQLTMGSFNKPINKYLLVQNNTIRYFQGEPIPTSSNIKAHNLIKGYIK